MQNRFKFWNLTTEDKLYVEFDFIQDICNAKRYEKYWWNPPQIFPLNVSFYEKVESGTQTQFTNDATPGCTFGLQRLP